MLICTAMLSLAGALQGGAAADAQAPLAPVTGHRFLTLATVVRVDQIEVTRDLSHGPDESAIHGPEEARVFREAIAESWPGGRITWWISDPSCHLAEPRVVGVVEGEQKGGAWTTPAAGPYTRR